MKRGGNNHPLDYNKTSTPNDYMLYIPPSASNPATSSSEGAVLVSNTPGMIKAGGNGMNVNLPDNFLYSMKAGCALCSSSKGGSKGGSNTEMKGGFALEPFISALALLGARMLADKEVGVFGKTKSTSEKKSSKVVSRDNDYDD